MTLPNKPVPTDTHDALLMMAAAMGVRCALVDAAQNAVWSWQPRSEDAPPCCADGPREGWPACVLGRSGPDTGCPVAAVAMAFADNSSGELRICAPGPIADRGEAAVLETALAMRRWVEHTFATERDRVGRQRELAEAWEELTLLHELPRLVSESAAEECTAESLVQRAMQGLGVDGALIAVRSRKAGEVRPLAWAGVGVEDVGSYCAALAEHVRQIGDEPQPTTFATGPAGGRWMVKAIRGGDRDHGLFAVRKPSDNAVFSRREQRLFAAIAHHAHLGLARHDSENELRSASLNWVNALVTTIDAKDSYTKGHSERVALLARRTGAAMGLDEDAQQFLQMAGLIHDLGKIAVSTETLRKPSALDSREWEEIRSHPQWTADIIHWLPQLADLAPAALHHHERWDGRGYPENLQGDDIPPAARVLAVSDAYDAMTSARPYRTAMPARAAREEMLAGRGTQFCPDTVDAFVSAIISRDSKYYLDI